MAETTKEIDGHLSEQKRYKEELQKMEEFGKKTRNRLRELGGKRDLLKMELIQLKDQEVLRPVPRTRLALEEEV